MAALNPASTAPAGQHFGLTESGEGPMDPPGTEQPGKRVLLRRQLGPVASSGDLHSPGLSQTSAIDRKQVLLAHKIRPGQTIQLKSTKATARMPDVGAPNLESELLVNSPGTHGPSYDDYGALQSFSVLGPVQEFERRSQNAGKATPGTGPHPGDLTATSVPMLGDDLGLGRAPLERMMSRETAQRTKSREALSRAENAEACRQRFVKTWELQTGHLGQKLGKDPRCVPATPAPPLTKHTPWHGVPRLGMVQPWSAPRAEMRVIPPPCDPSLAVRALFATTRALLARHPHPGTHTHTRRPGYSCAARS